MVSRGTIKQYSFNVALMLLKMNIIFSKYAHGHTSHICHVLWVRVSFYPRSQDSDTLKGRNSAESELQRLRQVGHQCPSLEQVHQETIRLPTRVL